MFVVIEDPESGEVLHQSELSPEDVMDAHAFADEYAGVVDRELAESTSYIPNCLGDIRVIFCEDPTNTTSIWSGESFYFKDEES